MTPEKREQLKKQLAAHGLTVILTKDFDSICLQLAGLVRFKRNMLKTAAGNPPVETAVQYVLNEEARLDALIRS